MLSELELEKMMLIQKQSLSLDQKINVAERRIEQFYEHFNGNVYVAFSGGKDSTVLLHLVRKLYPDVPAVFVDTGLEYPEIRDFVKTVSNVTWIKPEMNFKQVLETYGYPVISKAISYKLNHLQNSKSSLYNIDNKCYRRGNEASCKLYLTGIRTKDDGFSKFAKLPEKYHFLIEAPFKISNKCCDIIKKKPFHKFEKEMGLHPYTGEMASDSWQRTSNYYRTKCNSFGKNSLSKPLSIWKEKDIWSYIKNNNISYCKLYDMGYNRTGCMFCMFGMHMEKNDRFEMLKKNHPKLYDYCMNKLGLKNIINHIRSELNKKVVSGRQLEF